MVALKIESLLSDCTRVCACFTSGVRLSDIVTDLAGENEQTTATTTCCAIRLS